MNLIKFTEETFNEKLHFLCSGNLATFTDEILNGKILFYAVQVNNKEIRMTSLQGIYSYALHKLFDVLNHILMKTLHFIFVDIISNFCAA